MKTIMFGTPTWLRKQNMFAGLRHRAVSRSNDEDSAVHLGGTGNHVLDVVGVSRSSLRERSGASAFRTPSDGARW